MLELRYNGCSGCKTSAQAVLRNAGFFAPMHYRIEYHSDHPKDKIYQKRPDYLLNFTGAILLNPDTQHWIDFYNSDGKLVITSNNKEEVDKVRALFTALEKGE